MIVHYDCRHFLGHKPCAFRRLCEDCPHYAPFGTRILIIKLGAMGDVVRTTPLLRGLRREYPDCHVTWLTEPEVMPMLSGVAAIDRLMPYHSDSVLQLRHEEFDRIYCFDKEPKATALASGIEARERIGFGMTRHGGVMPLNSNSEYFFELGINDELKFRRNTRTYPELLFECAGLPYPKPQEYLLPDLSTEISETGRFLVSLGVPAGRPKVGLNTGASDLFATKKWTIEGYAGLADLLAERTRATVLLLGGPKEAERNERIVALARHRPVDTGCNHPIRDFAGIVGNLDLIVTGDTMAMHLAIGLGIPVLAILGSTCHREIELYGRGEKIVSDFDCSPCYLSSCPKEISCMQALPAPAVYEAASRILARTRRQETI